MKVMSKIFKTGLLFKRLLEQAQSGVASLPIGLEIRAVLLAAFDHHRRHLDPPRCAAHALQAQSDLR